jgi:hypothetical protein
VTNPQAGLGALGVPVRRQGVGCAPCGPWRLACSVPSSGAAEPRPSSPATRTPRWETGAARAAAGAAVVGAARRV